MNEPDTCRKYVVPNLVAAGWDAKPHSMVEFKQIIGRRTRVRDHYGKLWFNILAYTGTAMRNFADPAFDGDPAFATKEEIDEYGKMKSTEVVTPEVPEDENGQINETVGLIAVEPIHGQRRRSYYYRSQVEIATDRKQLRPCNTTDL